MVFFLFGGSYMFNLMSYYSRVVFENIGWVSINADNMQDYLQLAAVGFFRVSAPFIITIMEVGLVANYAQVGPLFTLDPLTPKFSKINPFTGMKRILFSRKAFVELIKNILKIIVVGLIAYYSIKGHVQDYVSLMDQSAVQLFAYVGRESISLGLKISIALALMAVLDFMFQKYDYERSIRMTKQEIKEEMKQMEGDPQIKARIRSIQRESARCRMMEDIPEADVVITNPVEIAVALKYAPKDMESPKVVAKGRKKVAEKIKEDRNGARHTGS